MQVAALVRAAQVRDAAAAQPDLGPGLGAGPDVHLDRLAVHDGHLELRAEGRLRDGEIGLVEELRALAGEARVVGDVDGHVQAAGGAAARPHLALVGQAHLMPVVDARRDRDAQGPLALCAALALAGLAGRVDRPALAVAPRARLHVDHLAEHRLADAADLAAAVALRAGDGRGAGLGARAAARVAAAEDRELDLLLRAR